MPYIKQGMRNVLDIDMEQLTPENAGELNYVFSKIAHAYWDRCGQNYQAFNDIIGAFEGAKLELYRRKVAPYEDTKIEQNGDV